MKTWYAFTFSLLFAGTAASAESLWLASSGPERSMFSDTLANEVGDILTIVVRESTQQTASQSKTTGKDTEINNTIGQFLFSPAVSGFGTVGGELPATSITGSNSFAANGAINNSQNITAQFSVTVIDKLPNGNLVVEGGRLVSYSKEKQYMVFRGIVRPLDIAADNSVISNRVADATLELMSEGTLSEVQRKGWLTKINDFINPF